MINSIILSEVKIHMKPLKRNVSISLDPDIIEKIKEYAEESDRSFSQYINILLRKHITAKEARQKSESDEN